MSETLKVMEVFTKFGLKRLRWITENLEDNVFDWKMTSQSNSIRWVLSHISIVLNVYFPRAITGDLEYYPQELPRIYLDNPSLSIQRILNDIDHGELIVLEQLGSLDAEKLKTNLDWYLGPHEREFYLMILCSEILHHGGQIAAILGNWRRIKGVSPTINTP
ncbi:MAG: DinB family protein [Candidatus Thorarchaeota archaeon]|jgi:hypothetical protein